jgi:hypothetical protein
MIKRRRTGILKNKRKSMMTEAKTRKMITLKDTHGYKEK